MAVVRNNFSSLLLPGLRKIWGDTYKQYPEEFTKIFAVDSSSRSYEEDHGITSLGLVPQKAEGKGVSYDTIYDGYTTRYTHLTYGLGFMVTREMVEDDLYRKIRQAPSALAKSNRHTIEIIAQNILNNSFSTAGADAVPMISASHPLRGDGLFSNTPTVAADFDVVSLEQALIDIQLNWVDDRGLKVVARPMKLICHANNDFQAKMVLKSAGLPDTANNNINPAQGILPGGHEVLHWLTDPKAWWIQTDVDNGLTFFWRRRPEFTEDTDYDSENAKYKTTMRFSVGYTNPRCLYGSAGA